MKSLMTTTLQATCISLRRIAHRRRSFVRLSYFALTLVLLPFALLPPFASSQQAQAPTEAVRPALSQISQTIVGLSVSRWKAPGDVRSATQRDIDSIQHDLSSTLPPLMDQAAGAPSSVASAFAVYRNIDALYDVLLRVAETATLAGPQADVGSLEGSLSRLESARRDLGNAILQLATAHDQELDRLRATAAQATAAATAPPAAPKKSVIEDGPASSVKTSTAHKKKKPVSKPAPSAAPATPPQ